MTLKLKERLIPVLKMFSSLMMLTLTMDPKLFASPEEAYWYVRDKRSVAELVRALAKAGHLRSKRYFAVVEWHQNGWPHWHVLVEAEHIPHKTLARLWGRNRPVTAPTWQGSYAGSLKGQAPEFGTVQFSKRDFAGPEHAANYALKYMLKQPQQGFPPWVLDSKRQIRMFATSHRLLPTLRKRTEKAPFQPTVQNVAGPAHADTCFCEKCRGESVKAAEPEKPQGSIRQRLNRCGTKAALVRVPELMLPGGQLVKGKAEFMGLIAIGFRDALEYIEVPFEGQRRVMLREWEVLRLQQLGEATTALVESAATDAAMELRSWANSAARRRRYQWA